MSQANNSSLDVAIVGIGCRFPGDANGPEAYWRMLCRGTDAIRTVPSDRWDNRRFYDPQPDKPGKTYMRQGGFLKQKIDRFDPLFFGISPREADGMDPQQRMLLEVAWEAIDDAGLVATEIAGSATGVFIGGFCLDNKLQRLSPLNRELVDQHTGASSTMTILSNRLSYIFDLRGPSVTIDTACSSSLVATHAACQAIGNGDCEMALCGGVNVMFRPEYSIIMSKGKFLSQHGRCMAFDDRAGGYTRGEGAGIVVLKPLLQAQRDGDQIYAVICATGVNQDGRTPGISMPSMAAQHALMERVCTRAGVSPAQIDYVEAHGTGTQAGDPIEAHALDAVLQIDREPDDKCWVGSVKTNIGHLEAAAGIAGLIKTALCLRHGEIPRHLHFENPNPAIDFDRLCIRIPTEKQQWPNGKPTRYAAVNSFGYGGTNAHALLREAPVERDKGQDDTSPLFDTPLVMPLSARSRQALSTLAGKLSFFINRPPSGVRLNDIVYTCTQRRTHHDHRVVVVANSADELREKFADFSTGEASDAVVYNHCAMDLSTGPVFVYTGMGPQWWAMGRELLETEPVFRDMFMTCDRLFSDVAGWSIIDALGVDENSSRVHETQVAQPANFAVQMALTAVWKARGVTPAAVVGHSVGEVAAACVAGALTVEDAIIVSYHRSRLQQTLAGAGGMLAVGADEQTVREYIGHDERVAIAAINSPAALTLAGERAALEALSERFTDAGVFNRMLAVDVPYHSATMDAIRDELYDVLRPISPDTPVIPLYSTVSGGFNNSRLVDAEYWWQNVRQTVRFADATAVLLEAGYRHFVEIGPHPVLQHSIKECAGAAGTEVELVASLRRKAPETEHFRRAIGTLFTIGHVVDWSTLVPVHGRCVSLPAYAWQRQRCWRESDRSREDRIGLDGHILFNTTMRAPHPTWQVELNEQFFPYLHDHVVADHPVFPGAGYIEAGLAIHQRIHDESSGVLADLAFHALLVAEPTQVKLLSVAWEPHSRTYSVHSRVGEDSSQWQLHASGTVLAGPSPGARPTVDREHLARRCPTDVDIGELYRSLADRGLKYGEYFQGVRQLAISDDEFFLRIEGHDSLEREIDNYLLHPTLLDAAFHTVVATAGGNNPFVLVAIERVTFYERLPRMCWAHARVYDSTDTSLKADFTIFDDDGHVFAEIHGVRYQTIIRYEDAEDPLYYGVEWTEADTPALADVSGQRWLLLAPPSVNADAVADSLRSRNIECLTLSWHDVSPDALRDLTGESIDAVVCAPQLGSTNKLPAIDDVVGTCLPVVELVKHWHHQSAPTLRLAIATAYAQRVTDDDADRLRLGGAALWGLGLTISNEHPDVRCTVVDIDDAADGDWVDCIVQELGGESRETLVAYRNGQRYGRRLVTLPEVTTEKSVSTSTVEPVIVEQDVSGQIGSLRFRGIERRAPAAGEVELRIHSTGINFKDFLKLAGLIAPRALEGTYFGRTIGMECSGTVTAVGDGVTNVAVGDNVVTPIRNGFCSYAVVDADWLIPCPSTLSMETSPVYLGYITAMYSLVNVARIQAGERVLIHNGTGGVGLAAIQIVKHVGGEIFTTAGSDEKREYLRSLGIDNIFDSRSLDFVRDIREATNGQGVDVVLNAISGDALMASFSLLAPYGRFLEIGKPDIVENSRLPMLGFNRNLTFAAIDVDQLYQDRPDVIRGIMRDISDGFETGIYQPMPVTQFGAAEIIDAFEYIGHSRHIGKVVVTMRDQDVEAIPYRADDEAICPDGTVLITGGTAGFGAIVARWLAEHGVGQLILASRRGPATEAVAELVDELATLGTSAKAVALDVTDGDAVRQLIADIDSSMLPLKGVIHGAMVLDDAPMVELDWQRFERVMAPKVAGALNLHRYTEATPLDFFICFSSISPLVGNRGQANYNAANAFLDALAHYRRGLGLPAVTINWGALSETGVLARHKEVEEMLAAGGVFGLTNNVALDALASAFVLDVPQLGVFKVDWDRWADANPAMSVLGQFRALIAQSADGRPGGKLGELCATLASLSRDERIGHVQELLQDQLARVLKIPVDQLDVHRGIGALGIDSLMTLELALALKVELGIVVPAMELLKEPSIAQLAAKVVDDLNLSAES